MLEEKKIGNITIGEDIEMDGQNYLVYVTDHSIKIRGRELTYKLPIHRELLEAEFYTKQTRMVQSFWCGSDEEFERMHELSFNEFEEHENYRDEFDSFVQETAFQILHVKELVEAKELSIKYYFKVTEEKSEYEAKIRELEKQLYQALNPNIKKAS